MLKINRSAGLFGASATLLIATLSPPATAGDWSVVQPLLDKHCARCHEMGKLLPKFHDSPRGKFGYVLEQDELVHHKKLVPGNADASEIWEEVRKGDMPKDIDDACLDGSDTPQTYCGLTDKEKAALHDSINALAAAPAPAQVASETPPPDKSAGKEPSGKSVAPTKAASSAQDNVKVADSGPAPKVDPPAPKASPDVKPSPGPEAKSPPEAAKTAAAPEKAPPAEAVPVPAKAAPEPPTPVETAPAVTAAAASAPIPFVTDRDIIRLISTDVANAPNGDGPNYRYLTLTHLANAGDTEKDLRVYRMALAKMVNSLSVDSDPYSPVAIDPGKTIYRLDIRRLGWTPATWNQIVAADPYVVLYEDAQFKSLVRDLGTVAPFIRGDWFAFSTSRPPLYYDVLGLPKTRGELQAKIGADPQKDFRERHVERAGFQLSGVSENNREVERHSIPTGMYWESYDFGSSGGRKSIFENPMGPTGAFGDLSDRFGFNQDGGEIIFSLPNGFHAYYLTDGKGNRLDIGPTKIVHDPAQRDLSVTNAISCFGCHDKGIKYNERRPGKPLDQVRDLVLGSGTFPPEVKEIVKEIFPTPQAFNERLDSDAKRYAAALSAAGINVNTRLDGVEVINALSRRFEDSLDARNAAAEVSMTEAAFMDRLDAAGGQAHDLKLRLQQDVVPRDQFVELFAKLVNTINDDGDKAVDLTRVAAQTNTTPAAIAKESQKSPQTSKTFDLAFFANTPHYRVGDLVTFTLRSEQPCFLTIIDTDDKGRSLVLFPNNFHSDGRIDANVNLTIPGPQIGGFKIRAPEAGVEHIVASCNASFPDVSLSALNAQKAFETFGSSRDLIAAQNKEQRREQKRLLALEKDAPAAAAPAAALVSNPIDPTVPISATKAVVLMINR